MHKPIYVTKSYLPKRDVFDQYINQIYSSNALTNFGPLHNELELKLKKYLNVEYLILVSNGTLAIQVALRALRQTSKSRKVITTPFSFIATTSSILWENYEPVFVDIDPETLNIDPEKIEEYLKNNRDVHAVLAVHVYGNSCDVEYLEMISQSYNVPIIYDAAHAFGSKYKSKSLLAYGELSTLSFHSTKIFHTVEGGAIIAKNAETIARIKKLINFGITGPDKVEGLGINCKMNEFQAAMGLSVLSEMGIIVEQRERVYKTYINYLSQDLIVPKKRLSAPNFSYFPILLKTEEQLFKVKTELENEAIYPRRYFYPSLSQLDFLTQKVETPLCSDVSKRILCLPMYAELSDEDIITISEIVNSNVK